MEPARSDVTPASTVKRDLSRASYSEGRSTDGTGESTASTMICAGPLPYRRTSVGSARLACEHGARTTAVGRGGAAVGRLRGFLAAPPPVATRLVRDRAFDNHPFEEASRSLGGGGCARAAKRRPVL